MVYRKKTYKRKKRVVRRKARVCRSPKHIYGAHKSWTATSSSMRFQPATGGQGDSTRLWVTRATDIASGTLYNDRTTNTVWLNNIQIHWNMRNAHTTCRYLRIVALTTANSRTHGDIANWTDLMTTGNFATDVGPTGLAEDMVYRINRNYYKPLWDKTVQLPGTNNGEVNSKNYKFNIPIKKFVTYDYDANTARQNPIWVLAFASESEGLSGSTVNVYTTYRFTVHFKDVLK